MIDIQIIRLARFTLFFLRRPNPLHSRIYFLWHDGTLTR